MEQRTCPECGVAVARNKPTGPVPTYCSRSCKERRYYRDTVRPSLPGRLCQWDECGTEAGPRKKWCDSHRKTLKAQETRRQRAGRSALCIEADCVSLVIARGLCAGHYSRVLRKEGRLKPDQWDDRRRDNYHARRARMAGARNGDRALLSDIVARDGTLCARCRTEVDLSLQWPALMSKSIDHIRPISRGGEHSLANAQLMHLSCNSAKGAQLA